MVHGYAVLEDHLQVVFHAVLHAVVGALSVVHAGNYSTKLVEHWCATGALGEVGSDGDHAAWAFFSFAVEIFA